MSRGIPTISSVKYLLSILEYNNVKGALPSNTPNSVCNATKPTNLTEQCDDLIEETCNIDNQEDKFVKLIAKTH